VTHETQGAAAARDGFVTYDQLRGPGLDAARWSPARLPLPTGGDHIPLDPDAALAVGEGEVRVTIPRFSLSHDTFQPADSAKYLIFSTRQFELPPDRPATFAVDLAVKNIGGEPGDFRRGLAAFHAFDFEVSKDQGLDFFTTIITQLSEDDWERPTVADDLAIPVIDLYVHAWDHGAAVGIAVEIPADVIDYAHAYIDPLPDEMIRGDNRAFGPQIRLPPGATPTERFIGWTGRPPQ
jgi:hypothetical protein